MNPFLTDIRAVFFDAVGTLIHPEPSALEVYAVCGRHHGMPLSPQVIRLRFGQAFRYEEEHDRLTGWSSNDEREQRRWRNIVSWVFHEAGTDAQIADCFDALFAHFAQPSAWRLAEGVSDLLTELRNRALILGVASNFDRRLHGVMDGMPMLAPLRQRVISAEVGYRKPDPRFFAAVVHSAGCDPGQILFVGDDRVNDYDGANAAGLCGLLLDSRSHLPEIRRIRRLTDLR